MINFKSFQYFSIIFGFLYPTRSPLQNLHFLDQSDNSPSNGARNSSWTLPPEPEAQTTSFIYRYRGRILGGSQNQAFRQNFVQKNFLIVKNALTFLFFKVRISDLVRFLIGSETFISEHFRAYLRSETLKFEGSIIVYQTIHFRALP